MLSLGEQLSLPYRASEVIFDSEVHGVSEVLPSAKWANLTSLVRSTNFTTCNFTFAIAKTSPFSAPERKKYGLKAARRVPQFSKR